MLILYALQTALPLALIGWLMLAPARNIAGFWTQSFAIAFTLVALGLVGIWTFPPSWSLWVFAALLALAVILGLVRRRIMTRWPSGTVGWVVLAGFGALGLYAAITIRDALAASTVPHGAVIALASPLGSGRYLVANGGTAAAINAHATFLDPATPSRRRYWGTGHGVDIVALDRWGTHADGVLPADPRQYVIFGRPVVAPCDGHIVVATDGLPDMPVPQVDRVHLAGNHVMMRCRAADILLGHFHEGSVRVRVGQRLRVGDPVARVGNSGNTSEPHLHVHAQRPGTADAPFSGSPLPIRIDGRYLVRNDRFTISLGRSGLIRSPPSTTASAP